MPENQLLDKSRVEIKLGDYGIAPAAALADPLLLPQVQDYRRQTGSRMYPLDKGGIRQKIPAADYHVSRKVDGEFTVLVYRDGQVLTLNPGGTVRVGLPFLEEAAQLLSKAGVQEAMVAGELSVARSDERRSRVHDVTRMARQPESQDDLQRLRFAVFDLISINGEPPSSAFAQTWGTIQNLFGEGQMVRPVESSQSKDADGVERLFHQWVEEDGAEGLVVRSDTAGLFKVKLRHTLDVAVIGFTEATEERVGLLHDLLLGIMRRDGTIQVLSRVGGGFSDDQRRSMLSDLKDMTVDSEYAEVNADHVAYQMVRPEWVIEISCLDLIAETTRGGPINRMVLEWNGNGYQVVRRMPLVTVISPQFIRRREDKSVSPEDVRIEQLTDAVEIRLADRDVRQMTLPKSEILQREVYTKELRGETMVRKFVAWKTNKETDSDDYPAYVLHYTDFSPNRKTPMSREVRVSNSPEQIQTLWDALKEANIKKGWEPLTSSQQTATAEPPAVSEPAAEKKKPPKKTVKAKPPTTAAGKKKSVKKKAAKKKVTKMAPSERTTAKGRKTSKKKTG